MAYATNATNASRSILGGRASELLDGFRATLAKRKLYNNTLRELQGLSDRELADLGLHRSMLRRIAYEAAYSA